MCRAKDFILNLWTYTYIGAIIRQYDFTSSITGNKEYEEQVMCNLRLNNV